MSLTIELTDEQVRALKERAVALGVTVERLATAAVVELISKPQDDYADAAEYVLKKNDELYRRLG